MNFNKERHSIEEVKELDLVDYLSKLGYKPAKIRNPDYWYLSPLRNEKTPSFKINRKINRWYDHGLGKGGNIIDFGILYYSCTFLEFLKKLDADFSFHNPVLHTHNDQKAEPRITVVQEFTIVSFQLLKYLEQRCITSAIADRFCREVRYDLNGKIYYGIGFKNDSGGFEIRNRYFKTSSSPKDITTFQNGAKEVFVFEGFIDFLSFMVIDQNISILEADFLILNSASFFEKARPFMEQHDLINLYLDNDPTGQKCSQYAMSISGKYTDKSSFYNNHKDLNEWLMNSGNMHKNNLRQKLQ